jgi:NADH-quinone oxidoreductase subunit N
VTLNVPSIHYLVIAPVLIFFGASLLLLVASAMWRRAVPHVVSTTVSVAASLAVLVVTFFQWHELDTHGATTAVAHAVVLDGFSVVATAVVAVCCALASLVAHDWLGREHLRGAEYQILALASTAGAVLMTQANDLIVIFLGLEILSLGLYVLVALDRRKTESAEASLKYFILGGFASAIFIYGAALLYGATGSTNLTSVSYFLGSNVLVHPGLLLAGGALLLVGFAFKIAAVPFHMWSPDVYEGAPTPVTGFMAAVVKVGAFAALIRVMISGLGTQLGAWHPILWSLIVLSTVVGATLAVPQRTAKRLLAYSSINHAGFILLGVWAADERGIAASLFYLATYAPVVVATFAIVTVMGGVGDEGHALESYRGLARRQPWLGASLAVLLLTQLGAPLTAGFVAKYSVLAAAVDVGGAPLALIALISAAVAASVYLRWTVVLYADTDDDADLGASRVVVPTGTRVVIGVGVAVALVLGVWPGPLVTLAQHAGLYFLP